MSLLTSTNRPSRKSLVILPSHGTSTCNFLDLHWTSSWIFNALCHQTRMGPCLIIMCLRDKFLVLQQEVREWREIKSSSQCVEMRWEIAKLLCSRFSSLTKVNLRAFRKCSLETSVPMLYIHLQIFILYFYDIFACIQKVWKQAEIQQVTHKPKNLGDAFYSKPAP